MEGAKAWTLPEYLAMSLDAPEMVLSPWLPRKGLAMLAGPTGIGKTFATLGLVLTIASGGKWLGWSAPLPRKCLLVDGEMDPAELRERFRSMLCAASLSASMRSSALQAISLLSHAAFPEGLPDLSEPLDARGRRLIERELEASGAEVLVLDNLSCLTGADENDGAAWLTMNRWLLSLRRAGKTVLFIHHTGKPDMNGRVRQRGISKREDPLNAVVLLDRPTSACGAIRWTFTKHRGFQPGEPLLLQIGAHGWLEEASQEDQEDVREAQVLVLRQEGQSQRAIAKQLRMSLRDVNKVLKGDGITGGNSFQEGGRRSGEG